MIRSQIHLEDCCRYGVFFVRDRCRISLLTLSELINFSPPPPRNYQKTISILLISGGIEVNQFA